MRDLAPIRVDSCVDVSVTPPRIVLVTCEECGCDSAKVTNAKPSPCQFCGAMPRRWWQGAFEGGAPPQAKEAARKRREASSQ